MTFGIIASVNEDETGLAQFPSADEFAFCCGESLFVFVSILLTVNTDQQVAAIHFAQKAFLGALVAGGNVFEQDGLEAATEQGVALKEGYESGTFGEEFLLHGADENATFPHVFTRRMQCFLVADVSRETQ